MGSGEGCHLLYSQEGHSSSGAKIVSFATGQISSIARLERQAVSDLNSGMAVSPDGHWLLCPLIEEEGSDIMLVENFR